MTKEDLDAASGSSFSPLRLPDVDRSTRLRFGQFNPQLIARRRFASAFDPFVDLGDDETISCARAGWAIPKGVVAFSAPFNEYRSHSSNVGSA